MLRIFHTRVWLGFKCRWNPTRYFLQWEAALPKYCENYCEIWIASLLAMNTLLFEFLLLAIQCEIKLFSQIKCARTLLSLSVLNRANSSTVQLRNNLKNADFWAQTNASIKRFLTFFVKVRIDEVQSWSHIPQHIWIWQMKWDQGLELDCVL